MSWSWRQLVSTSFLVFVVVTLLLVIALRGSGTPAVSPSDADIGFARDMSVHHAQAVELAGLVLARTDQEDIRTLATDIQLTQQAQIGQMHGWLDLWNANRTTTGPRMAWMGMPVTGAMPGMASTEQLDSLRAATGSAAERTFLKLMIEHHRSGLSMASAATSSNIGAVRGLAAAMVESQRSEIEAMEALLAQRAP